jgi:hypothetical protein
MGRSRSWIVVGLAGLLGAAMMVAPASADPQPQCGQKIFADTTLTADMACTGTGLDLTSFNGTLNLNGHTIRSTVAGQGVGLEMRAEAAGHAVTNGTIQGFGIGIAASGDGWLLDHVTVNRNTFGIVLSGTGAVVQSSTVTGSGQYGIWIQGNPPTGMPNSVLGSTITGNNGPGVVVTAGMGALIRGNTVMRNNDDGIIVWGHSTIVGNTITQNRVDGIRTQTGSNQIGSNALRFNIGWGIESRPGDVDLGGNKGLFNHGKATGCTGPVTC